MNQYYGVYSATVIENKDLDNRGRVKVSVLLPGNKKKHTIWARLSTLTAGPNRGTWFLPEKDDEVIIAFEGGDARHPYVLGSLWNEVRKPPETVNSSTEPLRKVIRTAQGIEMAFDDRPGAETVSIKTPGGHSIKLSDGDNSIIIEDSNGNTIALRSNGIEITSNSKLTISSSAAEINTGMLAVNTGMAKFSGVVQCDTMIANAVVSSSYTPGAGNIW